LAGTDALSDSDQAIALEQTPFFPQEAFQCGPAAVATVLAAEGLPVTPGDLTAEVYTPGLEGSLQPELLGAIRRRGLLAYELPPDLEGLASELAAGRPVLVLQNLGLEYRPIWHYAVVIGADSRTETLLLRSGTEARLEISTRKFIRSWDSAGNWGAVVLRPGEMPASPDLDHYRRAVLGLEAATRFAEAAVAWQAALDYWPEDPVALFGLGSARYALRDLDGARSAWERYVRGNPDDVPGLNNLAAVLGELGCPGRGLQLAERALSRSSPHDPHHAEVLDTVETLRGLPRRTERAECMPEGAALPPAAD
jgi:tetratricopeptide (TPR) repeat protein